VYFRIATALIATCFVALVSQPAWSETPPQNLTSNHSAAENETAEIRYAAVDSVADELGGVVVLCNQQSSEQNSCEQQGAASSDEAGEFWFTDVRPGVSDAQDTAAIRGLNPQPEPPTVDARGVIVNPAATRGLNPQSEPPTVDARGVVVNPAATRGLNPQPEPPTNDARAIFTNPVGAIGLNPQPEPPTNEGVVVSADQRAAFSALNGYDQARAAMSGYMLTKIQEGTMQSGEIMPGNVTELWNALASEAARQGHRDEIDIIAWSLMEDAMQAGNNQTRIQAQQLRVNGAGSLAARSNRFATVAERGSGLATGRRTYEPIQIPNVPARPIGEDGQLANVDLQNALQQQQQTMQMMSNISKMMHDTAMAVIRNIGG